MMNQTKGSDAHETSISTVELEGLLPCPFCGQSPQFEGDPGEWKDDSRYVELSIACCVTMTETIGWRRAREMSVKERDAVLRGQLTARWNARTNDQD